MKHIAVRSEVLNATVGGYKISISGLGESTTYITPGGLAQPYLPYVDVEVADDADTVSYKLVSGRRSIQSRCANMQSLYLKPCPRVRGNSQCYSPVPEAVRNVHDGFPEMVWQGFPAQAVNFVFELFHFGHGRHLTGAGGR